MRLAWLRTPANILTFFRSGTSRFREVVYNVIYLIFPELIILIDTPINRFKMCLWLLATNT